MTATPNGLPVVVTGGTGLIGSAVVEALMRRGIDIVAAGRSDPRCGTRFLRVDLSNNSAATTLETLPVVSAVVHCAASVPTHDAGVPGEISAHTNQAIDEAVIRFCRRRRLRLVYTSGTSVYGTSPDGAATENSPLDPSGPYVGQKVEAESSIKERITSHLIMRVSSPYGPRMRRQTVLRLFVDRALAGAPVTFYGAGARRQDFIHVDDVAAASVAALVHDDVSDTFNICAGSSISMKELAGLCIRLAGRPDLVPAPAGLSDPLEGARADFDIRKAADLLGWAPRVSLEDGIKEMVEHERRALA